MRWPVLSGPAKGVATFAAWYLGIGFVFSAWAATTWPEGVVWPVLVFIQNMVFWPMLVAFMVIPIGGGD